LNEQKDKEFKRIYKPKLAGLLSSTIYCELELLKVIISLLLVKINTKHKQTKQPMAYWVKNTSPVLKGNWVAVPSSPQKALN
jgi:hypothetical protein